MPITQSRFQFEKLNILYQLFCKSHLEVEEGDFCRDTEEV